MMLQNITPAAVSRVRFVNFKSEVFSWVLRMVKQASKDAAVKVTTGR